MKNFNSIVKPATSVVDGKVIIPYVFTKEDGKIHGFVPGFKIKDVVSLSLEECMKILNLYVKEEVFKRIKDNSPFPFFPNDDEIFRDFENVIKIERIEFTIPEI